MYMVIKEKKINLETPVAVHRKTDLENPKFVRNPQGNSYKV